MEIWWHLQWWKSARRITRDPASNDAVEKEAEETATGNCLSKWIQNDFHMIKITWWNLWIRKYLMNVVFHWELLTINIWQDENARFIRKMWMETDEPALSSEFSSLGGFIKCQILFVLAALNKDVSNFENETEMAFGQVKTDRKLIKMDSSLPSNFTELQTVTSVKECSAPTLVRNLAGTWQMSFGFFL